MRSSRQTEGETVVKDGTTVHIIIYLPDPKSKHSQLNCYSAELVLEITLFFTCSNRGALICNYLLDEASREHEFLTMNRQDS
jgi:hypothetical protein